MSGELGRTATVVLEVAITTRSTVVTWTIRTFVIAYNI